jgi:hypothetical protein
MRYVLSMVFAAMLLCYPALNAQAAHPLSADDVKFLKGCGVQENDIKAIPNLPRPGQIRLWGILHIDDRVCGDLQSFKATRDFLRLFTPPPSKSPFPPAGYDDNFLTPDESAYVNKVNKGILDKLFGH